MSECVSEPVSYNDETLKLISSKMINLKILVHYGGGKGHGRINQSLAKFGHSVDNTLLSHSFQQIDHPALVF